MTCWVEEIFLTIIQENRGIVMDNSACDQGKAMQKMTKDAGHTLLYALFS
ncbi:hypothetical protein [Holospora curviuscula]|nr:hypothetical protein [Holospora curviuscula]